jgi:hypothetical protein
MVLQPLLAARETRASIELTHRWKNLIHGSSEIVDALHAACAIAADAALSEPARPIALQPASTSKTSKPSRRASTAE